MSIDLTKVIRRGKSHQPPRIVIYGPEGIGKSTFCAESGAVIIPTEDGLGAIDCASFPVAETLRDVTDAITALLEQEHSYKAVAIDTVDWLEKLIWSNVAERAAKKSIEEIPYGKGYTVAMETLQNILFSLDGLRTARNMMVVVTAHAQVKRYDDPTNDPYDRYQLKMHQKSAEILKEWCDVLGFATHKLAVKKTSTGFGEVSRALSTGGTTLHLKRSPAFDAKNRYSLPDSVPFRWSDFIQSFGA